MLGSQSYTLSSSTSHSTPYSLSAHSTLEHADADKKEYKIRSQDTNQGNAQDEVIISQNSQLKVPEVEAAPSVDPSQLDATGQELTPEEQKEIKELKDRDREVRRHEQAHFQAAGKYANPPKYEYQTGPDGKRYAVGGSVEIDMSEVSDDPEATLEKARVIKRAALAPEEPSAQDRKVARQADKMAAEAQKEISEQRISGGRSLEAGNTQVDGSSNVEEVNEASTDSIASASTVSATETLEASVENMKRSGVSQYKTSRLEIGSANIYRVERLATPSKAQLYSPSLPQFDTYA